MKTNNMQVRTLFQRTMNVMEEAIHPTFPRKLVSQLYIDVSNMMNDLQQSEQEIQGKRQAKAKKKQDEIKLKEEKKAKRKQKKSKDKATPV